MPPKAKNGKTKGKAKGKAKSGSESRSPSPKDGKKQTKAKTREQEAKDREERYAILGLSKEDRKHLLHLCHAAIEACGSLNSAWHALIGNDSAKGAGLTLTQFSVGISNAGIHKANAQKGGDTIDAVACYNFLRRDPDSLNLSYKEFMALAVLRQDAEVRLQLQGVEQIGDKQKLPPIDRVLVELWFHILPHRSSSVKRKLPPEEKVTTVKQLLRAGNAASTSVALVKFEVNRLATSGVLVLREVLMTYSRSMSVVQEVMQLASCWAGIGAVRVALHKSLRGALSYVVSHFEDGITKWSYDEIEHLLDLFKKLADQSIMEKHLSPRQRAAQRKDGEETAEQKEISELSDIVEVSQRFNKAESMYEAAMTVDQLLGKLTSHSSHMKKTLAEYSSGAMERMRQVVVEYPSPFVFDFFCTDTTDPELGGSDEPGAAIGSTTDGGPASAGGVLPGWRLRYVRKGTKDKPIGEPAIISNSTRAQQILDRWGPQAQPLLLTFEGPEVVMDTGVEVGDVLDDDGKHALIQVLRVGMNMGAIPIMRLIKNAIILGGHWRHGVERFEELQTLAEEIAGYYDLGVNEGAPKRTDHLCWGLEGVPEELSEINAIAQTHSFMGAGNAAVTAVAAEEEAPTAEFEKPKMRPISARPYDRVRRPLSPTRAERPDPSEQRHFSAWYTDEGATDVPDASAGATPSYGATPLSSRPMSAVSRPMSALSRPMSAAIPEPARRSSRPTSAVATQRPRPMSAAAATGAQLHVRLPSQHMPASAQTTSPTRPASAPTGRNRWLYQKPSTTEASYTIGFGGIFLPPRRPPAGPWTRKCRENGAEVLRHKLTSCLLMSHASPF